jgi:O-antigen/teichoic acid export membrane protein
VATLSRSAQPPDEPDTALGSSTEAGVAVRGGEQGETALDARQETKGEREDRNLAELLQELRVAALGIQVLFGFLLAMPFAARFTSLSADQRHLYTATLFLAAVATALLSGPVAYHRIVFRRHERAQLIAASNTMALAGLAAVGLAIASAVWLVLSVVDHGWPIPFLASGVVLVFFALWFLVPMAARTRRIRSIPAASGRPR